MSQAQDLDSNSTLWKDSIWQSDIEILSSELFNIRQQLIECPLLDSVYNTLDAQKNVLLKELDSLYLEEIFGLKESFQRNTLRYIRRMQAYSYLSSDLAFDVLLYCPKTYNLFVNTVFNVHPFQRDKQRIKRANKIIEGLKVHIDNLDSGKLSLVDKLVEDLKKRNVSTANRWGKGLPTEKETYYHELIDAMLLSIRLAYK